MVMKRASSIAIQFPLRDQGTKKTLQAPFSGFAVKQEHIFNGNVVVTDGGRLDVVPSSY